MSDMVDAFRAMTEESKERRAKNRDSSAALLRQHSIAFEEKNGGAHLVISDNASLTVDFWPGTGKWKCRGSGQTGRGVFALLKRLGVRP